MESRVIKPGGSGSCIACFNRVVKVDLTEKGTLKQRLEGGEAVSCVDNWEEYSRHREESVQSPIVGVCLATKGPRGPVRGGSWGEAWETRSERNT